MTERDLIHRAQRGDREAAEALCAAHWHDVYRILYGRLGNRAEAEDLTQETFMRLWRSLGSFRGDSMGPFVRTIARNLLRNHLRDAVRHRQKAVPPSPAAPSAEDEALVHWSGEELMQALQSLGADQETVLRLRLVESLPVQEVAERMGRSPEAVRALQYRALQQLRAQMAIRHGEVR